MNKYTALLIGLGLTACSPPYEDLHQWMQNTQQQSKAKIKKPEPPKLPEPTTYIPPPATDMHAFSSARLRMGMQGANAPDLNRPKEVLENFSLENLSYVGSLSGAGKHTSAYVAADGHVYTVRVGNYLGQNYGRISAIEPGKLVVTELVEDSYGNWIDRPVELPLSSSDPQTNSSQNQ